MIDDKAIEISILKELDCDIVAVDFWEVTPVYRPIYDKKSVLTQCMLTEDFTFRIKDDNGAWHFFTILAGFKWNGNSIPLLFSLTGTRWGLKILVSGLVHDYLYGNHILTRRQSDRIHYLLGRLCKKDWWSMQKMHKILRLAGWRAWGNYEKKKT